jgi:hypothetical protein
MAENAAGTYSRRAGSDQSNGDGQTRRRYRATAIRASIAITAATVLGFVDATAMAALAFAGDTNLDSQVTRRHGCRSVEHPTCRAFLLWHQHRSLRGCWWYPSRHHGRPQDLSGEARALNRTARSVRTPATRSGSTSTDCIGARAVGHGDGHDSPELAQRVPGAPVPCPRNLLSTWRCCGFCQF